MRYPLLVWVDPYLILILCYIIVSHLRVCLQSIILDALSTAGVGRPVQPVAVRDCKGKAQFNATSAGKPLTYRQVESNINSLVTGWERTARIQVEALVLAGSSKSTSEARVFSVSSVCQNQRTCILRSYKDTNQRIAL
jgi:hypothetical protein